MNLAWQKLDMYAQLATFGEQVRYLPTDRPAQLVYAIIERRQTAVGSERGLSRVKIIRCTVLKDPDAPTFGGIADPELRDQLRIVGEQDLYTFSGEVFDESTYAYKLEFTSDVQQRMGGSVEAR